METWIRDIERAKTEDEVVANARDYVALWAPRELAELPEDCRHIRIEGGEDIPRWRGKLAAGVAGAREQLANAGRVGDLVTFLDRASRRIDELRGRH